MLLLPVSHQDGVVRRVPWVSIGILAACVALQVHSCAVTPGLERRAREASAEMSKLERQAIVEHWTRSIRKGQKPLYDQSRSIDDLAERPSSERAQDYIILRAGLDAPRRFRAGELTPPGDPRFVRYIALVAEL